MKLIDQAHKNISILRDLTPDDILLSRRFVLQKQDEYVQPDNISDFDDVSAIIIQSPNKYGILESWKNVSKKPNGSITR